jgi:restriction system protein
MARRRGLAASLAQFQREMARAQAAHIRAQATAQREAERARKAYERAQAADERERKRLYIEARTAEVDAMNEQLDQQVATLESLLGATLSVDDHIDFDSLKAVPQVTPYDPGALAIAEPPPDRVRFAVPPLGGVKRLLPGAKDKHATAVAEADQHY